MASDLGHLWQALDFKLSELLKIDLWCGVLGGAGGLATVLWAPDRVIAEVPWVIAVVVAVIGAALVGLSVQVAWLDQAFLRKLRAIKRDPIRYLAPFLFTTTLGIVALVPLAVLASMTSTAPAGALGAFASNCQDLWMKIIRRLPPGAVPRLVDLRVVRRVCR